MRAQVIGRADALARGVSDAEMQRMCRTRRWRRLRPGMFVTDADMAELDARDQHRLVVRAVLRKSSPDAVVSHQSAAVLHGIELWNTPLRRVHLTRDRTRGGRQSAHRHVHASALPVEQVTTVDGTPVTSAARTVVDLARFLPFEEAVVAGDHARHIGAVAAHELDSVMRSAPTHPGNCRARRVLGMLDGRSESVGESRSRALFVREQLPIPELQSNLFAANGIHIGRADFLFSELGVVGEFDGRVKYGKHVPEGEVPSGVLWAEKLREDAIRDAGWQVVRWTWSELETPELVADRLRAAIKRAQLSPPPTGQVVHTPIPGLPPTFNG